MAKAAEAFRTISEVADDLGIQKHVLRFWEVKFSQIRPMKRGGGRRYYRPEDMELLRGIRQLLHRDGYTIKGVQKILREQGVEAVKERVRLGLGPKQELPSQSQSGEAAPTSPAPAKGRRGKAPVASDRKAVIAAVIAELELCRGLLAGARVPEQAATGESRRPERRSRRSA
ncbi:MAG: MerR family transcriptional regulator [Hyphomicrobiaceae bacterium]